MCLMFVMLEGRPGLLAQTRNFQYEYQPAAADNPLKGLVPYHGQSGKMPHSMEFWYFPMRDLMTGPAAFDWAPVEEKLESARQRGHQMVLRIYLEFPGRPTGVPQFLIDAGLAIEKYSHDNAVHWTPDYDDPRLIKTIEDFVFAFGSKYDGDPRIGFLHLGIVGHWGEWHTYPRAELFPSKPNQVKIMEAFAKSFKKTKVLMRYPAGNDDWQKARNTHFPFGYHDDSFSYATLETGKEEDSWFYMALLRAAGNQALEKWKTEPIGGEIRPEVWGCVFDKQSCAPKGQELEKCISATHASWMLDTSFPPYKPHPNDPQRIKKAIQVVQGMGYELHVSSSKVEQGSGKFELVMENRGVAPFYYPWDVELLKMNKDGEILNRHPTSWDLRRVGSKSKVTFSTTLPESWLENETGLPTIGLRVINPMQKGKPFRFANRNQNEIGVLELIRN